jgi:hypothetical protein
MDEPRSIWPTILELTDGKPKLLHESGTRPGPPGALKRP